MESLEGPYDSNKALRCVSGCLDKDCSGFYIIGTGHQNVHV